MKALSVRNPYATMIFTGEKEYEFRTWRTDFRGDLLICSTKLPKIVNHISGYALCVVQLTEIFEVTPKNYKDFGLDEKPDGKLYAWQLKFKGAVKPFPVKGKLNFFEVPDDLIDIYEYEGEAKTEEEAQAGYDLYYAPFAYKGNGAA